MFITPPVHSSVRLAMLASECQLVQNRNSYVTTTFLLCQLFLFETEKDHLHDPSKLTSETYLPDARPRITTLQSSVSAP